MNASATAWYTLRLLYKQTALFLCCWTWGLGGFGQVFQDDVFREAAHKGLALTYNFDFEAADAHFSQLQAAYPDHPAPYYLLAFNRWWQSYISHTDVYHSVIEMHLKTALKHNQAYINKEGFELEYTFFQYMIYAFQSRLHILRREWWSGANTGLKALPYLTKGINFVEESPEFYFSTGIYHYYAETYPRKHAYIKPFMVFFPEGNASKGLEELRKAADLENFTQIESQYYLGDIYLEEEKAYRKAIQIKRKLSRMFPQNTWFEADYARALVYDGQYESAHEILSGIRQVYESQGQAMQRQVTSQESRYTSFLMIRVYHYLGRVAMAQEQDVAIAEKWFGLSQQMANLEGLMVYEYEAHNLYQLAEVYVQQNKKEKARKALRQILELEENAAVLKQTQALLARLD